MRTIITAGCLLGLFAGTVQATYQDVSIFREAYYKWTEYDEFEPFPFEWVESYESTEGGYFEVHPYGAHCVMGTTQISNVVPGKVTFSGSARGQSTYSYQSVVVYTLMEYKFEVLEPISYEITGNLFSDGDSSAVVYLLDSDDNFVFEGYNPAGGSFSFSGQLMPDTYRLRASAGSHDETQEGLDFELTLTPEPCSLLLLAGGACLIGRRRRGIA